LAKALPDAARLESVALQEYRSRLEQFVNFLVSPAPLLLKLSLTCSGYTNDRASVKIPEDLFSSHTPRLRKLELIGCFLPWTSKLYFGLTSLTIRLKQGQDTPRLSPQQLYQILSDMPELQQLELSGISLPDTPSHPTITFPQLEKLYLEGHTALVARWLAKFHYPSSSAIRLFCRSFAHNHVASLTSALARTIVEPSRTLRVSCYPRAFAQEDDVLRIEGWPTVISFGDRTLGMAKFVLLDVSLHITRQWDVDMAFMALVPLFSACPCHELKSLCIQNDLPGRYDIDELFTAATSLESVHVQERGHQSFIKSLASDPALNASANSGPPTVVLPNLRHLAMNGVLFGRDNDISQLETLSRALELRSLRGFRLERLDLRGCLYIHEKDAGELRQFVDAFEWDGYISLDGSGMS
jgi:hypothetical protein